MCEENKAISELQDTLWDLVRAHIESENITLAEIIGVLQITILNIYHGQGEDEEE